MIYSLLKVLKCLNFSYLGPYGFHFKDNEQLFCYMELMVWNTWNYIENSRYFLLNMDFASSDSRGQNYYFYQSHNVEIIFMIDDCYWSDVMTMKFKLIFSIFGLHIKCGLYLIKVWQILAKLHLNFCIMYYFYDISDETFFLIIWEIPLEVKWCKFCCSRQKCNIFWLI